MIAQRLVFVGVLAAAAFGLAACSGGGGPAPFAGQRSSQVAVAFDAKVLLKPQPGPLALDVARARELVLEIHDGTDLSSPVASTARIPIGTGTQISETELPGLGAGSYLIVARVTGDPGIVLAETGCVFSLAPGPATDLSVVISSAGVRLGDGTGACPGGNPLPPPGFGIDIVAIDGPSSAARGQSGIPFRMRVINTGSETVSINSAFLAFGGAGISSLILTNLPVSIAPAAATTLSFAVAVANTASVGTASIRGIVIASGPSVPTTSISELASTSLTVRAAARPVASAELVIGQPDRLSSEPNAGGPVSFRGLCLPAAAATDGLRLAVSDTGNNRVLIYDAEHPSAPLAVLGQADFSSSAPGSTADRMRAPARLAFDGGRLLVEDAGNDRVLIFDDVEALPVAGGAASAVLGELAMPRPNVTLPSGDYFVADTTNHRVLRFPPPATP